jgi:hypothetical protein
MIGRSGEIRTHDPQHPMLMRYQAALRSDRAALPTTPIIVFRPKPRNGPGCPQADDILANAVRLARLRSIGCASPWLIWSFKA